MVLLTPIEPATAANGLAMRTELFRRGASDDFDVQTLVVPVAGRLPHRTGRDPGTVVIAAGAARTRAGAMRLIADARWRGRLTAAEPLPTLARAAHPGLVDQLASATTGPPPIGIHVMRAYLAPLGAALAERLEPAWMTLDLDEDDAAFADALGHSDEASAYRRLLDVFGPLFAGLSAASPLECRDIGERHGLRIDNVPNVVELASPPRTRTRGTTPGAASLLFVGNLTYGPNVAAAHLLVESVAPALRRPGRSLTLTLVGPRGAAVERLRSPGVVVTGFVPDLEPLYATADLVVVPLAHGAGTRIKVLEAFAHGVPVVASPTAVAGLAVEDGRHLLLAEDAQSTAAAAERILADDALAKHLVAEASRLVRDRYAPDVGRRAVRELFTRAAQRGRLSAQLEESL